MESFCSKHAYPLLQPCSHLHLLSVHTMHACHASLQVGLHVLLEGHNPFSSVCRKQTVPFSLSQLAPSLQPHLQEKLTSPLQRPLAAPFSRHAFCTPTTLPPDSPTPTCPLSHPLAIPSTPLAMTPSHTCLPNWPSL